MARFRPAPRAPRPEALEQGPSSRPQAHAGDRSGRRPLDDLLTSLPVRAHAGDQTVGPKGNPWRYPHRRLARGSTRGNIKAGRQANPGRASSFPARTGVAPRDARRVRTKNPARGGGQISPTRSLAASMANGLQLGVHTARADRTGREHATQPRNQKIGAGGHDWHVDGCIRRTRQNARNPLFTDLAPPMTTATGSHRGRPCATLSYPSAAGD